MSRGERPPAFDSVRGRATPELHPVGWRERLKLTRPGPALAALRRLRRVPGVALRAETAAARDRLYGWRAPPPPRSRDVRSVACLLSGPAPVEPLLDSIEAVLASEGDACQVVVVDDGSIAGRERVLRDRYPEVAVVRNRRPTGGPPNMWRQLRLGLEHSLERFRFEIWFKLDTDALLVAPGAAKACLERLAAHPRAGIAGSYRVRADGKPEQGSYHAAVIAREIRHDRVLAAAIARATESGWAPGDVVQGGGLCLTRAACEALRDQGWLAWPRPWSSLVYDDLALTAFTVAAGFQPVSLGDPAGLFAVGLSALPLAKEEIADGPWVVTHSLKRGLAGETEAELRAYFRARRAAWTTTGGQPAASG